MVLHKFVRKNYGEKSPVGIKFHNLHSLKEGVILLCQSILETRLVSHLYGSALFAIPLKAEQEKLVNFEAFDLNYVCGKIHFEDNGTQNYLVLQPVSRYFKTIANTSMES